AASVPVAAVAAIAFSLQSFLRPLSAVLMAFLHSFLPALSVALPTQSLWSALALPRPSFRQALNALRSIFAADAAPARASIANAVNTPIAVFFIVSLSFTRGGFVDLLRGPNAEQGKIPARSREEQTRAAMVLPTRPRRGVAKRHHPRGARHSVRHAFGES